MKKSKLFRAVTILTVLTMFNLVFLGCFGKFALTHKVVDFNTQVEGKVPQSLVCAIFIILPVYGIAFLIDWIILNVIEFYTGENPATAEEEVIHSKDGKKAVMKTSKNEMTFEIYENDTLINKLVISKSPDGKFTTQIFDAKDAVVDIVSARDLPSGGVYLAHGDKAEVLTSERVVELTGGQIR